MVFWLKNTIFPWKILHFLMENPSALHRAPLQATRKCSQSSCSSLSLWPWKVTEKKSGELPAPGPGNRGDDCFSGGTYRMVPQFVKLVYNFRTIVWLVVLTISKNISQWEGLCHILWKLKNVWNQQPVVHSFTRWWCTYLKNMTSSVEMMTFLIYGKIIQMFQTTNQFTITIV